MIEAYESGRAPAFELYGLGARAQARAGNPAYSGLTTRPMFVPSVGNFRQGMLVSIPLQLDALAGQAERRATCALRSSEHYRGSAVRQRRRAPRTTRRGAAARAGIAQRHQRHAYPRLRQRGAPAGGAGRQARQSRQGRVRRGGAKPRADARPVSAAASGPRGKRERVAARRSVRPSHPAARRRHRRARNRTPRAARALRLSLAGEVETTAREQAHRQRKGQRRAARARGRRTTAPALPTIVDIGGDEGRRVERRAARRDRVSAPTSPALATAPALTSRRLRSRRRRAASAGRARRCRARSCRRP